MGVKDGGPAFPPNAGWRDNDPKCQGMSLRDYAAIHTEQPGMTEICDEAGVTFESKSGCVWDAPEHHPGQRNRLGSFNQWWTGLSKERRYELNAKVRYAIADAMLKERDK